MDPGRTVLNARSVSRVPSVRSVWVVRSGRNAGSVAGPGRGLGFAGRVVVRARGRERVLGRVAGIGQSVATAGLTVRDRVGTGRVRVVADSAGRVGTTMGRGGVRRWTVRGRTDPGVVGLRWVPVRDVRGVDVRWVPGRAGTVTAGACGVAGCGAAAEAVPG